MLPGVYGHGLHQSPCLQPLPPRSVFWASLRVSGRSMAPGPGLQVGAFSAATGQRPISPRRHGGPWRLTPACSSVSSLATRTLGPLLFRRTSSLLSSGTHPRPSEHGHTVHRAPGALPAQALLPLTQVWDVLIQPSRLSSTHTSPKKPSQDPRRNLAGAGRCYFPLSLQALGNPGTGLNLAHPFSLL